MLSALVQSQAAIVAIVITLTLIPVQITALAYSHRVICAAVVVQAERCAGEATASVRGNQ
jgi:hypothetical protein